MTYVPIDVGKIPMLYDLKRLFGRDCTELYVVAEREGEEPQPGWHRYGTSTTVRW